MKCPKTQNYVPICLLKIVFCWLIVVPFSGYGQTFLNGSFENNSSWANAINLSNMGFNNMMPNCFSFGTAGQIDILTTNVQMSGLAQHGSWFVALHGGPIDQLSFQLSSPLVAGECYTITFYDKGSVLHQNIYYSLATVELGLSASGLVLGTPIYTTPTVSTPGSWTARTFTFNAPNNGQYITIHAPGNTINKYVYLDNFTIEPYRVDLGNDTSVCEGQQPLVLDATVQTQSTTATISYSWQDGTTTPQYTVKKTGTYIVDVNINGCIKSDTIQVIVDSIPEVNLGADTTTCDGKVITVDASTSSGSSYLWQDGSTDSILVTTQPGTYHVTVTNNCGPASDTMNITKITLPNDILGNDTALCKSDSLILDASMSNATYLWSDQSTYSRLTVFPPGTFWTTVFIDGCQIKDTIQVKQIPDPVVNLGVDTSLCDGDSLKLDVTVNNGSYLWENQSIIPTRIIDTAGTYWVEVKQNGCKNSDSVHVGYNPVPWVNFGPDTTYCKDDIVTFEFLAPQTTYSWHNGSTYSNYRVREAGTYWVTATNRCGSTTDTIHVDYVNCACSIHIPNAFSPNYDGLNDHFFPKVDCELVAFELYVFDRWGEELFHTSELGVGWGGTYKNKEMPVGVYVYRIYYKTPSSHFQQKIGSVALIRD